MKRQKYFLKIILLLIVFIFSCGKKSDQLSKIPLQPNIQSTEILPGHSIHGHAYDEGPRQKAKLLKGMGTVYFPISTTYPDAQLFMNQGVAQLHGFLVFEAERSFRQVAAIDPHAAMAYWGAAMANTIFEGGKAERAAGFIKDALKQKAFASDREKIYIDALAELYRDDIKDKELRHKNYTLGLLAIVKKYPNDLEAKAFLVEAMWEYKLVDQIGLCEHEVDAMIEEILVKDPTHPAHHYKIHLWNRTIKNGKRFIYDVETNRRALKSAALSGLSAPGIAHMWHMPGHIYDALTRYWDSAWGQEASARIDHKYMIENRVLPYEVFNYFHNQQWLIQSLQRVGDVSRAVVVAKNLSDLPRHPSTEKNSPDYHYSSHNLALNRLTQTIYLYDLWSDVDALIKEGYLAPISRPFSEIQRRRILALWTLYKASMNGRLTPDLTAELDTHLQFLKNEEKNIPTSLEAEERDNLKLILKAVDLEIKAHRSMVLENRTEMKPLLTELEKLMLPLWEIEAEDGFEKSLSKLYLWLNQNDKAIELAKDDVLLHPNEVLPLANLIDVLFRTEHKEEAKEKFRQLQKISEDIDLNAPIFRQLSNIAKALNVEMSLTGNWKKPRTQAIDIGNRPSLDDLGPILWTPSLAPDFSLLSRNSKTKVSLSDYKGKNPILLILYLGSTCEHCVAQLQKIGSLSKSFKNQGIDIVAISSETQPRGAQINPLPEKTIDVDFPLLPNKDLSIFKSYLAYDDFENQPLHGTFLIDQEGYIRWQDISYQPFMDIEFLIKESERLLKKKLH